MSYRHIGCCVNLNGPAITEMVDNAVDISRKTFRKRIGQENYVMLSDSLGYVRHHKQGLTLSQDYHVNFARSKYRGKPCYYLQHSAIEHVFVKEDRRAS